MSTPHSSNYMSISPIIYSMSPIKILVRIVTSHYIPNDCMVEFLVDIYIYIVF